MQQKNNKGGVAALNFELQRPCVHVLGMVCKVIGACITLCSDWLTDLSICPLPWELVSDWTVVLVVMASAMPPLRRGTLSPLVALLLFLVSLEITSSSSSPWYALGAESSSSSLNFVHFFLRLLKKKCVCVCVCDIILSLRVY